MYNKMRGCLNNFWAYFYYFILYCILILSFTSIISTKASSFNTSKTQPTTSQSLLIPGTTESKFFPKIILSSRWGGNKQAKVHNIVYFQSYYIRDYTFIVQAPVDHGIIMVIENLFLGTQIFPNGSCTNFIQVTELQGDLNKTFSKICGEVNKSDRTSVPLGLIGPRTSKFSSDQIIIRIKLDLDEQIFKLSGKLIFTAYTNCTSDDDEYYDFAQTRSCSTKNNTNESTICISKSLFCDGNFNCGNVSGTSSFDYDESWCLVQFRQNIFTPTSDTTFRYYNNTRYGGGRIPLIIPMLNQKYPYNSPINNIYNPSSSAGGKSFNIPKVSSGISSPGKGITKGVTKVTGKIWKYLVGFIMVLVGGISSIFGCKKKSQQLDTEQAESELDNTLYQPPPGPNHVQGNDRNLETEETRFVNTMLITSSRNILEAGSTDDKPPSYEVAVVKDDSAKLPPPYSSC